MIDPIKTIKQQNNTSGGNLLDVMPVKVEMTEVDLSLLESLPTEHPRLLIQSKDLPAFRSKISKKPDHCQFDNFINNSVYNYINEEPYNEPEPYPEETVGKASLWRPYWRKMYVDCQMAFNATRNLSMAGVIVEYESLIAKAKAWLLELTSYDPEGVTSRGYNDEASFRVIASLAWGYDWLYNHLSVTEKTQVKAVLIIRLEEIMHHLKMDIDLFANPLNSHGVRSISSAIVPACIALYGEYSEAKEYLHYSLQYYSEHYPPWGGNDGAWAEGPDYWNTAMAFLGEAFDLIKSYTSINMFNKEFYKNTGDFILYCMPVHSKRASFCDQSSIGDYPGLKLAYNMRHFAGVNKKSEYIWYYNQLKMRDSDAHTKFYNYGWWDFGYDDLRFEYLWEDLPEALPLVKPLLKVFPQTGWAAFHSNMTDREQHIHMIFKCSPFGSTSHSHGDQNAFTLHAFGETLASITGYYIGFGVDMHLKWRRQTYSKNLPLFGGKGQYAESKSSKIEGHQDRFCVEASGFISDYNCDDAILYVEGDATSSYQFHNKDLLSYKRKIWFVKGKIFVMRDRALLSSEQDLTWLLHTTYRTETRNNSFRVIGEKAHLDVQFINASQKDILSIETVKGFGEVDPKEYEGLEIHRHVETKFKASKCHDILTLLIPQKVKSHPVDVNYKIRGDRLILMINGEEVTVEIG